MQEAIKKCPYLSRYALKIEQSSNNIITVTGKVESFFHRQMALESIKKASEGQVIVDKITVK